jgi:hypothetical protein
MDKKIAGLAGVLAAATAVVPVQAAPAPQQLSRANAYADLLKPIPDAVAELKAADAAAREQTERQTQVAQYWGDGYYYHHHHHHHNNYWRRRRWHHHHHHHHWHHHHHHHHHWWGY